MKRNTLTDRLVPPLTLAVILFLFLPLTVYGLNLHAVDVPKSLLIRWGLLSSCVFLVVLGFLSSIPRFGRFVAEFSRVAAITLFVLIVFPNRTGEITGIAGSLSGENSVISIIKLLVVALATIIWRIRRPLQVRSAGHLALGVSLSMSLCVAIILTSRHDRTLAEPSDNAPSLVQMGKGTNVVVIVLDCFTGYKMVELLEEHPELIKSLRGFTLYPRALAAALNTQAGISTMLTGEQDVAIEEADWYARNRRSLTESFLVDAQNAGLDAAYLSFLLPREACGIPFANEQTFFDERGQTTMSQGGLAEFTAFWVACTARVLPVRLVRWIGVGSSRLLAWQASGEKQQGADVLESLPSAADKAVVASKLALDHLIDTMEVGLGHGRALFFHSKLTHPPHIISSDGRYDRSADATQAAYYATRSLGRLFDRMRKIGVYENSLVIIVADHGAMSVKDRTMGGQFAAGEELAPEFNPLVMVKQPNAGADFRQSEMTVWLGDVAATVRDLLGSDRQIADRAGARSLLGKEDVNRVVKLALFFRPDQSSHHSRLADWARADIQGVFADFGPASQGTADRLLSKPAQVSLLAGRDELRTRGVAAGWMAGTGVQYRAAIEVNGRLLAKRDTPGALAVFRAGNRFQVRQFDDPSEWMLFLGNLAQGTPVLTTLLHVQPDVVKGLGDRVPEIVNNSPLLNVIYVMDPPQSPKPSIHVATNDVALTIEWKP